MADSPGKLATATATLSPTITDRAEGSGVSTFGAMCFGQVYFGQAYPIYVTPPAILATLTTTTLATVATTAISIGNLTLTTMDDD